MKMGILEYVPSKMHLFIDRSKQSLKCVFLHNKQQM